MKIRAAVLRAMGLPEPYAQSRPVAIEEVELARPGRGEVLLRIHAAGLCHSDLSAINGDRPWPMPIVIGHEAAAEVIELGEAVTDLAVGDHVVLIFRPSCGACASCSVGRPALCTPGARPMRRAPFSVATGGWLPWATREWTAKTAVRFIIIWAARLLPSMQRCLGARWCGSIRRLRGTRLRFLAAR